MSDSLLLSLLFFLGVLLQAFLLIYGKKVNYLQILIAFVLSLIAFLPGKRETVYNLYLHILVVAGFFSFFFAAMFQKQILPRINEQTVLIFTVVLWYVFIVYLFLPVCIPLLLIPTFATLYISFSNAELGYKSRIFFYSWFLVIVVALAVSQFSFGTISLFMGQKFDVINPIEMFFTGMAFLYLVSYVFYVFYLIPFPGKRQSISERIEQWKEYLALLSSKYSTDQMNPINAVLILLSGFGILFLNHFLDLVSDYLIINAMIVLSQIRKN